MQTPDERLEEITELAEDIGNRYLVGNRVEPINIINDHNILFCPGKYGDAFDGVLELQDGQFAIYCNEHNRGEPRKRFTLGHELGHFFICEHREALISGVQPHGSRCEYTSDSQMEREADTFSANLLMPKKRFLKRAKRVPRGLEGVLKLANELGTSVTSTAVRYLDLYLDDGLIVKWDKMGHYAWRRRKDETSFSVFNRTIKDKGSLVSGSATHSLISGSNIVGSVEKKGTTKSAWYPYIKKGGYTDIVCQEEAVRLGRFGYLTLVYPV